MNEFNDTYALHEESVPGFLFEMKTGDSNAAIPGVLLELEGGGYIRAAFKKDGQSRGELVGYYFSDIKIKSFETSKFLDSYRSRRSSALNGSWQILDLEDTLEFRHCGKKFGFKFHSIIIDEDEENAGKMEVNGVIIEFDESPSIRKTLEAYREEGVEMQWHYIDINGYVVEKGLPWLFVAF